MASERRQDLLGRLRHELQGIDALVAPSAEKAADFTRLLKGYYDVAAVDTVSSGKKFGPLSTLTVEHMDLESLWEQLQTRNRPLIRYIKKKTSSLYQQSRIRQREQAQTAKVANKRERKSKTPINNSGNGRRAIAKATGDDEDEDEDEDEEENAMNEEGDDDDDDDDEDDNEGNEDEGDVSEEDDDDLDGEGNDNEENLVTDDKFLDDMNDWLDQEEERLEQRERKLQRKEQSLAHKGAADDYDDSDSEEDEEAFVERELYNEKNNEEPAFKYADFFGNGSKTVKANKKTAILKGKGNSAMAEDDEDDEDDGEGEDEEDFVDDGVDDYDAEMDDDENEDEDEDEDPEANGGDNVAVKSTTPHQRHKLQLAAQIKELEAELIGPKSWELRGEVKGSDRPENSLLGVTADAERASKPAPLVTQEYTSSLEDLIRQRIDEERFDDVTPPVVRDAFPDASAEDLHLSQEKNKAGLGDIYAQEFLSQSLSVNKSDAEAKREEHAVVELKTLFHKICRQLDALSHFNYTPRPALPEASVSSAAAVPSISMEDIIPSTVSGALALAPEEVHRKSRGRDAALLSEAELTSEDRKRRRRASKSTRRKQLRVDNQENEAASRVGKASKQFEEKKLDAVLRSDSRVIEAGDNSSASAGKTNFSKSASFFGDLQKNAKAVAKTSSTSKASRSNGKEALTSSRVKL